MTPFRSRRTFDSERKRTNERTPMNITTEIVRTGVGTDKGAP
jgi:hypothetical protein